MPENVREVAAKLEYRDFIAVGLLVDKLKVQEPGARPGQLVSDNWIYIQEPDVLVGRLQIFNNWSPFLVADRVKVWLGAEYFCYETDELWTRSDESMAKLATDELAKIGIIERQDVLDAMVVRMPKTYPAYFGTYDRFQESARLPRCDSEPVPGRPQRHAQVQQPGPLHADGNDRRGQHHRRTPR